ncbi:S8 family serine peptidase [Mycobacterium sp. LTG2003]
MTTADPKPASTGLSPKVEVIAGTSPQTNRARARQSPSVAVDVAEPGDTLVSVYVHLDAELDDVSKGVVTAALAGTARRVRWKSNSAMVEVRTQDVARLALIPGIGYVETGLSLSAPRPTDANPDRAPEFSARRIAKCRHKHRYGEGVLVGIIDVNGFDFAHPDFLDDTGHTRFEAIWDQGGGTRPPPPSRRADDIGGFEYGSLIRKRHMDAAIDAAEGRRMVATSLEPQSQMVPGSHGTHVASIAAGNRGVARKAHVAGVLIDLGDQTDTAATGFYDSTRVTDAVDFLLDLAAELGTDGTPLPVSINISLGTNGHAHDSTSPTAQWIDHALSTRGRSIAVASGNAGQTEQAADGDRGYINGRIHASGTLRATGLRRDLTWIVEGSDQVADISENEMEIWYCAQDRIEVAVRPPGGVWSPWIKPDKQLINRRLDDGTRVSIVNETYYPANGFNRISILLSPRFPDPVDGVEQPPRPITAGQWTVRLHGIVVRDGGFDAWIERDDPHRHGGNLWDFPSYFGPGSYSADRMINSLACPDRVIAVANIDARREKVNVSSSRGPTRDGRCKPDIGADGTDVVAACGFDPWNPWTAMTGTSMASPYVCGVAALMLAAHPWLTAAQIQGIIRATSTPLIGHNFNWRKDAGFGLINPERCVEEAAGYNAGDRQ